jgi:hypothetical protein
MQKSYIWSQQEGAADFGMLAAGALSNLDTMVGKGHNSQLCLALRIEPGKKKPKTFINHSEACSISCSDMPQQPSFDCCVLD